MRVDPLEPPHAEDAAPPKEEARATAETGAPDVPDAPHAFDEEESVPGTYDDGRFEPL